MKVRDEGMDVHLSFPIIRDQAILVLVVPHSTRNQSAVAKCFVSIEADVLPQFIAEVLPGLIAQCKEALRGADSKPC